MCAGERACALADLEGVEGGSTIADLAPTVRICEAAGEQQVLM